MIPIRLSLRNFMCYRDNIPIIDFESIHTACISGNNGNGKSALIDAITWALWGQTRATSDDDLVHAGQNEAEVVFDFAVGQQQYRIIRKHTRPKTQKSSGQTILEFQAFTPDGYKVLSGDTTTQTQQKITQTLRMDYETFINSVFLRQGRADEFTKKRPGERKQVLGNILQLSIYDELENLAKEQVKQQENTISQLESAIHGIQEDLNFKPAFQNELEQAEYELAKIEQLIKGLETRLTGLRRDKETLENKKSQLKEITAHLQDTEKNYQRWYEHVQQCQKRINSYETLISQREKINEGYSQLTAIRKQCQELDQKLKQFNTLTQSKHRLEMIIIKAGEELNRSHAISESRIRVLEDLSGKLPQLQDEMKQLTAQLQALEKSETKLREKQENSKLLQARVHFLQAEKIRLLQEVNQIDDKLKMLSVRNDVSCPLCETELGIEGQKRIESKYLIEKAQKTEALKANQSELEAKETEARALENEILQSETKLKRARESGQNKYGNLSKAINDAQEAREKIKTERQLLKEIEEKLSRRDFATNEQAALAQIEKEMDTIGYSPQQHDMVRSQLASLEQYETPWRKLEEAERLILQEKEAESKAQNTVEELKLKIESGNQRRQLLLSELNTSPDLASDLTLAENEHRKLLSDQKRIQETIGGAKARLERLAELEKKHNEKKGLLAEAQRQEKIYRDLTQAFGKKGIQAMLIEMAIPEIEAEANKLLARMTDNRMHIKIETQRETKKGDILETLDINISDELGTRNYEMFSGGEAFRIDFAIRIALSKLLARRAGAPSPTLIIDEGFGTQDSTGIEKIKEAITSIQDDFEKILVITHITDFKDAFPMRIEVVKTPDGSTIYLN